MLDALKGAIADDRVAHAYLFTGPAHVGKTLTALQLAQALNCTSDERPCGSCRQCERIAGGSHADVEIVTLGGVCKESGHDHASETSRDIRICQVRRIEEVASRAPFEGTKRVYILDPADRMNEVTQNALLKTLEEPPAHVVLILVTDREEMLLPTIRSRVRRMVFGGLPKDVIERTLRTRWNIPRRRGSTGSPPSGSGSREREGWPWRAP